MATDSPRPPQGQTPQSTRRSTKPLTQESAGSARGTSYPASGTPARAQGYSSGYSSVEGVADTAAPATNPLSQASYHKALVIGRVGLQNTLLCKTLAKELGLSCDLVSDRGEVPRADEQFALQLLDQDFLGVDEVIKRLETAQMGASTTPQMALFNVTPDADAVLQRRYFGWPALRGVFARDCDPSLLVEGVRGIQEGQLWIPRRYLESFVVRHRAPIVNCGTTTDVSLTRKEEQILRIMLNGRTNVEIARQLSISPHTVKTHIYNLYKKLDVANRIEAVMWGRLHLEEQ